MAELEQLRISTTMWESPAARPETLCRWLSPVPSLPVRRAETDRDVMNTSANIGLTFYNGNYGSSESVACGNVARGEDCSHPSWSGSLTALAGVGYDNIIGIGASTDVSGSGSG
jgi:hypothetical protein